MRPTRIPEPGHPKRQFNPQQQSWSHGSLFPGGPYGFRPDFKPHFPPGGFNSRMGSNGPMVEPKSPMCPNMILGNGSMRPDNAEGHNSGYYTSDYLKAKVVANNSMDTRSQCGTDSTPDATSITDLLKRLQETGMLPILSKTELAKTSKGLPASFEKPETLKM